MSTDQLAVDEKAIRLHGQEHWLYDTVDPATNEILHVSLFPITTKQTTGCFLDELHRRYQLEDVLFLVDDRIILHQFSLKTATDFRWFHTGIGMLSNVSLGSQSV